MFCNDYHFFIKLMFYTKLTYEEDATEVHPKEFYSDMIYKDDIKILIIILEIHFVLKKHCLLICI